MKRRTALLRAVVMLFSLIPMHVLGQNAVNDPVGRLIPFAESSNEVRCATIMLPYQLFEGQYLVDVQLHVEITGGAALGAFMDIARPDNVVDANIVSGMLACEDCVYPENCFGMDADLVAVSGYGMQSRSAILGFAGGEDSAAFPTMDEIMEKRMVAGWLMMPVTIPVLANDTGASLNINVRIGNRWVMDVVNNAPLLQYAPSATVIAPANAYVEVRVVNPKAGGTFMAILAPGETRVFDIAVPGAEVSVTVRPNEGFEVASAWYPSASFNIYEPIVIAPVVNEITEVEPPPVRGNAFNIFVSESPRVFDDALLVPRITIVENNRQRFGVFDSDHERLHMAIRLEAPRHYEWIWEAESQRDFAWQLEAPWSRGGLFITSQLGSFANAFQFGALGFGQPIVWHNRAQRNMDLDTIYIIFDATRSSDVLDALHINGLWLQPNENAALRSDIGIRLSVGSVEMGVQHGFPWWASGNQWNHQSFNWSHPFGWVNAWDEPTGRDAFLFVGTRNAYNPEQTANEDYEQDDADVENQLMEAEPPCNAMPPGNETPSLPPIIPTPPTTRIMAPMVFWEGMAPIRVPGELGATHAYVNDPFLLVPTTPGISVSMLNPRVFAYLIDGDIHWDGNARTATFSGLNSSGQLVTVMLAVGRTTAQVNGHEVDIAYFAGQSEQFGTIAPYLRAGRMYVSLRFLGNAYGLTTDATRFPVVELRP